ncbi:hypothetical protein BG003_005912 [Podila horticola]|nr:hypothetical protein BG003_005912 [Podila horticola]
MLADYSRDDPRQTPCALSPLGVCPHCRGHQARAPASHSARRARSRPQASKASSGGDNKEEKKGKAPEKKEDAQTA